MMKSKCGHKHDDPFQALACFTTQRMAREGDRIGDASYAAVVIPDDDDITPSVSLLANPASTALMAAAICEAGMAQPRPTDCAHCMAAYDRMTLAFSLLMSVREGSC